MKNKSSKKTDPVYCTDPDPATFNCNLEAFRDCVIDKHYKSYSEFQSMKMDPSLDPRTVSFAGIGLDPVSCGLKLIEVVYDPNIADSNEDISVSLIDWPTKKSQVKKPRSGVVTVYFSDVLFNAIDKEWGIEWIEMHKAYESKKGVKTSKGKKGKLAPNSIVFSAIDTVNRIKYRGNLTSQVPFMGNVLP